MELSTSDFVKAIRIASRGLPRSSTIPHFQHILMREVFDGIELSASDSDVRISARIDGRMSVPDCTIPAIIAIGQALNAGGDKIVEISPSRFDANGREAKDYIQITSGNMTFRSKTWDLGDLPITPLVADDKYFSATLGDEAMASLRRTSLAASVEETRYYLNGVYLKALTDEAWKYAVVATDGHRLYKSNFPLPDAVGEIRSTALDNKPVAGAIIPRTVLGHLFALTKPGTAVSMCLAPRAVRNSDATTIIERDTVPVVSLAFNSGNIHVEIVGKLIDGMFPDYRRVIPKETPWHYEFNRLSLRKAVAALNHGPEKNNTVAITLGGGTATLASKWHMLESACEITLPVKHVDQKQSHMIGINARYLLNIMDSFNGSERVIMSFGAGPVREDGFAGPVVVRSPDDEGFMAVQMPMRV